MRLNFIKTMLLVDSLANIHKFVSSTSDLDAAEIMLIFKYLEPQLSGSTNQGIREFAVALINQPQCPASLLEFFCRHRLRTLRTYALYHENLCPLLREELVEELLNNFNAHTGVDLWAILMHGKMILAQQERLVDLLSKAPQWELDKFQDLRPTLVNLVEAFKVYPEHEVALRPLALALNRVPPRSRNTG